MNAYELDFYCWCPVNRERIPYRWRIEVTDDDEVLKVEDLEARVHELERTLHEKLADQLYEDWGGFQTLVATHSRTTITTTRGISC